LLAAGIFIIKQPRIASGFILFIRGASEENRREWQKLHDW